MFGRGFYVCWILIAWTVQGLSQDRPFQSFSDPLLMERGLAIYKKQCASCHGEKGEGVAGNYPEPLTGDSTVGELTKVIHDTMPEGEPERCIGGDAEAVATYIHQSFYSPEAQSRNNPPKAAFARLTGNQLRQSLADLYARFGGITEIKEQRGVKGLYFNGDRFKKENQKIERIDKSIDFDFGKASPGEGIEAEAFYIYWEGSLKVEQTGRYEIIVRSSCSFKMDFGKIERLFIDNHVQSGDKTEFRQSLYLTAGRLYPFKIDFIQRKRKTELPPAKISLSWVPPAGVEQIIPERNLVPSAGPGVFALQSVLPPDDRSYGFDRGIAVNRQWDDSTTSAAIEFAAIAAKELYPRYLRNQREKPNENRALLKAFLRETLDVAFRGALDDESASAYVDLQVDKTEDDSEAIKRVLLLGLKSPRFLYPLADSRASISQRAANRMTLVLYDSLPSDEWLLKRISKNELVKDWQLREAAKRMVNDYRAHAKTREFFYEWMNLSYKGEITKSQELFPGFDAPLLSDLRASLDAFLDEVATSPSSDYRQLFLADWSYTSDRIAKFYGEAWKPAVEGALGVHRTARSSETMHGVLTHPYLMSALAYHDTTSPIHRGIFLMKYVLGRSLRPPADAFAPLSPELHPDLTTRERVALQTSPENCQACHSKINSLGFALENYDAVGRFRDKERNKPIDPTGSYRSRRDELVEFRQAADLASYLANSSDSHRAFVTRIFQHFVKQPPDAFGSRTLQDLTDKFVKSGYNIRDLIVEIAVVASLIPETSNQPSES